ncbi:MAG: glycoside hydrolase family 43 protein [Lachnospiraceae bacterium]|nr:glycoside hydrolase family 43 protein [Lachnospiraceae bacterium]
MKKVWALGITLVLSMALLSGCKDKADSASEEQTTEEKKDAVDKNDGKDDSIDITINMTPTGEILTKDKVKHVTVHDPSIVRDEKTGMYYIFGSHMAWAKSKDMVNWSLMFNNINSDYRELFAEEAKWAAKADSSYDVSGNLWAPDVIYNEKMGKWCMYMSVNGPKWNSTICLLTADSPDGDWTYVGPVIQSGMSNGFGMTFDYKEATGESTVATNRYTLRKGNPQWEPHAIDPCVVYDENGDLWMSYGSWSGGIGLFRLDNETGLRDYETTYEYKSGVTDPYFGYKISGGNQRSGEASYIEKIGDYYYLFITYGGLVANGGYNMRIFRAEDITGPYVDMSGDDARYPLNAGDPGSSATGDTNGNVGIKVMSYYKWPFTRLAQVAQGHNSAWTESDGRSFLVYHRRTNDGTEGHEVRVHQMFVNEDGWLVTAPHEYRGEMISEKGYDNEKLVGSYTILEQRQSINYTTLEYVEAKDITLNADGTVTGDYNGKWSVKENTPYVTITDGDTTYKGVFIEQAMEDTDYVTMCFTILGDNELSVWGSKYLEGQDAIDICVKQGTLSIPAKVEKDIELQGKTLYGTTVTYESSDTSIISNDGKVTYPEEETKVTITATFKNGDAVGTKEYIVRVIALSDVDMEAFDSLFFENFNDGKKTEWGSPNALGALTLSSDNDDRKQYLQFISGNDSGNRAAYRKIDEAVSGKFTLSFDAKLTAGTMSNRSQSAFVVLSSDSKGYDANAVATGGYLLKLTNEPPADANGNNENKSNQTKWKLNDTEEVIDIPVDTWVTMTLEVDSASKTVRLVITDCKLGTTYFDNNITPAGACDFAGFQMLRGRGVGTMSIDSIKAK